MSKYKQKPEEICECEKNDLHNVEVKNQQDVEKILKEAECAKNTYYYAKGSFSEKFNVTIELSEEAKNPEIAEEVCRILKEEFLKNYVEGSGQKKDSALPSFHALDKEEKIQC